MNWTRQLITIIVLGFLLQWAVSFFPQQKQYESCGTSLSTGQQSCLNYPIAAQLGYPRYFVKYETQTNACWKDAFVPSALLINILIWHGIAAAIVLAVSRHKRRTQKADDLQHKKKPSSSEVILALISTPILIFLWWFIVSFIFRSASCF